jgi:transposase
LEDWVGEAHPARFIREFVDALELKELGFQTREAEEGRPNYAADLLLKVWLYGYLMRIRSSRGLERGCRENLGLIWLTGMNEPDHNTLWRFFSENKRALRQVFKQAVRVAVKAELVGLVLHAVDGTKIAARASRRGAWHKADLEKALRKLDASLDEALRKVEVAEGQEQGEYRLPAELKEREQLRERIKGALAELEAEGVKQLQPQEPEARMMPCGGRKEFGYNAQAVVDSDNGLIVATEVVNEAADHGLLVPMMEEVEAELGEVAEETVADAGYSSAKELHLAEERGYGVLVSLGKQREVIPEAGEYHPSKFRYEPELDQCVCPRGEVLSFENESRSHYKYPVRIYRCQSYKECPVRWQCSRNPGGRKIELSVHHLALSRQREKQREAAKQAMLRRRQAIVEPVFGQVKQAMGFRRWTVGGLEGVRTQWSLLCTAVNLSKLHRFWVSGRLVMARES